MDGSFEPSKAIPTNPRSVIVYRDSFSRTKSASLLCRLQNRFEGLSRHHTHDEIQELLIDYGDFETAALDALCPSQDSVNNLVLKLRHVSVLLGRSLWNSWTGDSMKTDYCLRLAARETEKLPAALLPPTLTLHTPEGYAYYGLAPEMYMDATRQFWNEHRPAVAVCLGIRSIGTSLSGVVAGTLEELGCGVLSFTVRPRGHPFDRRIWLSPELARRLDAAQKAAFLIVDEGPGLSGTSFASIANALIRLGISENRIFLFPSWVPDSDELSSESGRDCWNRHVKYSVSFNEVMAGSLLGGHPNLEISAGAWRPLLFTDPSRYPAVHPQHEMRKFLVYPENSPAVMYKFAGYGSRGRQKLKRARQLERSGFGIPVLELRKGFLVSEFVPGEPLNACYAGNEFIHAAEQYLVWLQNNFHCDEPVHAQENLTLMQTNVEESLGTAAWSGRLKALQQSVSLSSSVALDGRMLPHEWIRTTTGRYMKTDALDHHDDHFFPGRQDLAWDVAALCIEFNLGPSQHSTLIRHLQSRPALRFSMEKLRYYRIFYLACRVGYTTLAARTLYGTDDGTRFESHSRRYRLLLESQLRQL